MPVPMVQQMETCVKKILWSPLVQGFEPGCIEHCCFKCVLYCMICSLPRQGQILCIELGIELKIKRISNYIIIHFTMPVS